MFQVGNNGRDHNPEGYTVWMAEEESRVSYVLQIPLGIN